MIIDAQTLRRALSDFFKFNPKDFRVQGSATGYLVSAMRQRSTASDVSCPLKMSLVNAGSVETPDWVVRVAWGTINGMQPTGFTAGGLTPFDIAAADGIYIYASATVDATTLQWTSSEIISDTDPALASTATVAYRLLGSVASDGDGGFILSSANICGPIAFNYCDLLMVAP